MKIEIDIPDDELRHCVSCESGEMTLALSINETVDGYDITNIVSDTYDGNIPLKYRELKEPGFHCKAEESGWKDALACNDCPNKCEEWHQWDKEFKSVTRDELLRERENEHFPGYKIIDENFELRFRRFVKKEKKNENIFNCYRMYSSIYFYDFCNPCFRSIL